MAHLCLGIYTHINTEIFPVSMASKLELTHIFCTNLNKCHVQIPFFPFIISLHVWVQHIRRSLTLLSRVSWFPFPWTLGVVVFKDSSRAARKQIGTTRVMVLRSRRTFRRVVIPEGASWIYPDPHISRRKTWNPTNQTGNVSISATRHKSTLRGLSRLPSRECC